MKRPAYLQPGATIALVCPAGYMPREKTNACVKHLKSMGYAVKVGRTVGGRSSTYFSGTDEERLHDMQQFLDDPNVQAILCARGGYGSSRILDRIDWKAFKKNPKWLIGFSDITIWHGYLENTLHLSSIHGPMARAFDPEYGNPSDITALLDILQGKSTACKGPIHPLNRPGNITAPIVGGNLALIAHSIGTTSGYQTKGKMLFIEDIGEQRYAIDRMMIQLKQTGMLKGIKGLIVGGFTEIKDTDRPFGKNVHSIIFDAVREYSFPVCFGFPISHGRNNFPVAIGQSYRLIIDSTGSKLMSR